MIIGLVGYIGSGKNTAAEYFIAEADYKSDSFAATLKDVCAVTFDWPRHLMEGDTKESRYFRETIDSWWSAKLGIGNFTPRLALQLVGTNTFRNHFHSDMWLLTLQKRYETSTDNVIITDARFPNEIEFIRELGGQIIFVDNGKYPEWKAMAEAANKGGSFAKNKMETQYEDVHFSEWAWAGTEIDEVVYNTGSLNDLKHNVLTVHTKIS